MINVQISSHYLDEGEKLFISQSLIYIAAGTGELQTEEFRNSTQHLKAGKAYLVETGKTILSISNRLLNIYIISLNETLTIELNKVPFATIDPLQMLPNLEELLLLQNGTSVSQRFQYQAKLWEFFARLTSFQEMDDVDDSVEYIERNLSKSLTVTDLAAKARMTSTSFARAFKKKTGLPPKEFIVERKMKRAKELIIQNKGIAMKDIAYQLGIQDEFYFSRMFKKREGMAPTIYLKRAEERVAIVSQLFLQDHLLSLGIQPVAAPMYPSIYPTTKGVPSYLSKQLEGTLLLNAEKAFNSYEIFQASPDSIIKTSLHHDEQQAYSWTCRGEVHSIEFQPSWKNYLMEIAVLMGKEAMVAHIENELLTIERNARDQLCPVTKQGGWAVLWSRKDELRLYGYSNHACMDLLFQTLGFDPHAGVPKNGYRVISPEDLALLNPDKILFLWSTKAGINKLAVHPAWKLLKAVQNNNIFIPDSKEWDPWGPLGRKYMINQLVAFFNKPFIFA